MKNLKAILAVVAVVGCTLSVPSRALAACEESCPAKEQQNTENRKALRRHLAENMAGRIASQLKLDEDKAKAFKEIYMRRQAAIWEIEPRHGRHSDDTRAKNDAEADSLIKARFDVRQAMLDLEKKYYAEFAKILTPSQIDEVYRIERRQFDKLRRHRSDKKNKPRKPRKRPTRQS